MSEIGAHRDYGYGRKKVWRRWCWNRICEKIGPNRKDKTVLYLAGPDDADRVEAIRRGFKNENIVGIDICPENIKALRQRGGWGINADLSTAVYAWPEDLKIDVIIADFCQGFAQYAFELLEILFQSPAIHSNTVIMANMQRGRDAACNGFRENMKIKGPGMPPDFLKHRGRLFFFAYCTHFCKWAKNSPRITNATQMRNFVNRWCDPVGDSYRSTKGLIFDTIIFRHALDMVSVDNTYRKKIFRENIEFRKTRAKIAALRAMQTMAKRERKCA